VNLNHLHLHVASPKTSAGFYERWFGMRELVWHGDMVFMRDEAGMDLALAPNGPRGAEPFPSWFHIGFRLEDRPAVEALFARMQAAGAPIREPVVTEGDLTYFRTADPDGHQIEVYYEPDPTA
jgi:catechol 2,3-dioxygenase-like lactoylglutathione lyase family enzyme